MYMQLLFKINFLSSWKKIHLEWIFFQQIQKLNVKQLVDSCWILNLLQRFSKGTDHMKRIDTQYRISNQIAREHVLFAIAWTITLQTARVYLHRERDLFRSPRFQTIERRRSISSRFNNGGRPRDCKLIVKCRARSANYKNDRT